MSSSSFTISIYLSLVLFCCNHIGYIYGQTVAYGEWTNGRSSLSYNPINEGACNYQTIPNQTFPYQYIAVPNEGLFSNAEMCGQCYEIRCIGDYISSTSDTSISSDPNITETTTSPATTSGPTTNNCCSGDLNTTITVQVTDSCLSLYNSQWCSGDMSHMLLSSKGYNELWTGYNGVCDSEAIYIQYRRVSCDVKKSDSNDGNIIVTNKDGINKYWYAMVIENMAGYGELSKVEILDSSDKIDWTAGYLEWYNAWVFEAPNDEDKDIDSWTLPFSVRLTDVDGKIVTARDLITSYQEYKEFDFGSNFQVIYYDIIQSFISLAFEFDNNYEMNGNMNDSNVNVNVNGSDSSLDGDNSIDDVTDTIVDIIEWYVNWYYFDATGNTDPSSLLPNITITTAYNVTDTNDDTTVLYMNFTLTTSDEEIKNTFTTYVVNTTSFKDDIINEINTLLDETSTVRDTSFIKQNTDDCVSDLTSLSNLFQLLCTVDVNLTGLTYFGVSYDYSLVNSTFENELSNSANLYDDIIYNEDNSDDYDPYGWWYAIRLYVWIFLGSCVFIGPCIFRKVWMDRRAKKLQEEREANAAQYGGHTSKTDTETAGEGKTDGKDKNGKNSKKKGGLLKIMSKNKNGKDDGRDVKRQDSVSSQSGKESTDRGRSSQSRGEYDRNRGSGNGNGNGSGHRGSSNNHGTRGHTSSSHRSNDRRDDRDVRRRPDDRRHDDRKSSNNERRSDNRNGSSQHRSGQAQGRRGPNDGRSSRSPNDGHRTPNGTHSGGNHSGQRDHRQSGHDGNSGHMHGRPNGSIHDPNRRGNAHGQSSQRPHSQNGNRSRQAHHGESRQSSQRQGHGQSRGHGSDRSRSHHQHRGQQQGRSSNQQRNSQHSGSRSPHSPNNPNNRHRGSSGNNPHRRNDQHRGNDHRSGGNHGSHGNQHRSGNHHSSTNHHSSNHHSSQRQHGSHGNSPY